MLHEVLKLVTCLSIITTTTSSSYLTKESLINYRYASPSSIQSSQSSQQSNDGEGFEWSDLSNAETQSQSDYLIPQLVNVKDMNNMLYTELKTGYGNNRNQKKNNNKKLSPRARGKKDNNSKLANIKSSKLTNLISSYDNQYKRNNLAGKHSEKSNNVQNVTEIERKAEDDINSPQQTKSSQAEASPNLPPAIHEFPVNQLSTRTEYDRELQQLFGIEGAKKYQNYQFQQLMNANEQAPMAAEDEGGVEFTEPQVKRNEDMNGEEVQDVAGAMVNQIMPRATRRQREYDVPLIRK